MPFTALRPILLGAFTPALLLLGLLPSGAQALGLGRPLVQSVLGKPLDLSVPLTLADGEQLPDGCLRAEVSAGDARVPAGLLQLRVEGEPGQQRIRVQSVVRIEEPALRLTLALGCPVRLTREFSLAVDPLPGAVAMPPPAAPTVVAAEPRAQLVAQASAPTAPAPATAPAPRPRPQPRAKPRTDGPRLVLERPEVLATPGPQRQAAASTSDLEMTPELEAQITLLEQTVAQLKAELQARQAAQSAATPASAVAPASASAPASVASPAPSSSRPASDADAIPRRVTAAPSPASVRASSYRDPLNWLMTLALSLLAGSAAFYGSRWLDQRARRENAYWRALQAAAEGAAPPPAPPTDVEATPAAESPAQPPAPEDSVHAATRPQPRPMVIPPSAIAPTVVPAVAGASTAPQQAMMATQPMPVQAAPVLAPPLTLADELLDLQQQTDFLLLLGQHEAAADLLATHLQGGAASAMPYLMLMELCQQRGEPEVFAELARQFEKRFGALAPSWTQSIARGRSLDACPSVIAHLQVVWADPAAAMQMVQQLLGQGGGPGVASFDLPAYRDLLTLYSVSRDLFEAGMRGDGVDLLLPLD